MKQGALMQDAWANGGGPPLGREMELADLLRFLKRRRVRNVVVVTADVHYAAAHYYSPDKAQFRDALAKAGFYADWKQKYGNEAWSVLEKYSGKLA